MKERVLIVVPAYNEADSIVNVITEIKQELKGIDILVVNDCSVDNTGEKVRNNRVKCIDNVYNMGYAMSVQTGIKYAKLHNFDYVIQMDADGQHPAIEARKLLEACIEKKADIALGTRYYKGSTYKSPFFRRFGTKLFVAIIRIFCKKKITDPLSGFQCINKRVIDYYSGMGNYPEYPDAGLIIEMLMKRYKIIEIPVKMRKRQAGVSMHSGLIKPAIYMITQFYTCIVIFIKFIGRKHE